MKLSDEQIIQQLKKSNTNIIRHLFDLHYDDMCRYAFKIIEKQEIAEEVVQDVFVYLWEKRETISIHSSVKNYIVRAVKNQSINYLKSKYANLKFDTIDTHEQHDISGNELTYKEISKLSRAAIKSLPERCAIIFKLSRIFGMTYNEIAENLEISPKTVENQIIIALKRIRAYLDKYY